MSRHIVYWRIVVDEPCDRFNDSGPFFTIRYRSKAEAMRWFANEMTKPVHPWRRTANVYLTNSDGLREPLIVYIPQIAA
jgi:hypothetical protein